MNDKAKTEKVVIVGGGVAAMEAVLALHHYAGGRVHVSVLAPENELTYRPARVGEPFGRPLARTYPLAEITADTSSELLHDKLSWIDPAAHELHTGRGGVIGYDAVLLATGARMSESFATAVTLNPDLLDEQLHGIVQDIEAGLLKSIAFVIPDHPAWPLPLYELALMTAHRAFEMQERLVVTLVTPEDTPLSVFGTQASAAVAALLDNGGVEVVTASRCSVHRQNEVTLHPSGRHLLVDRVIALPELHGLAVPGIPRTAPDGFVAVDRHSRVIGLDDVYAAGDLTDFPIKHGGIAAQQADAAAESIAALAGVDIDPAALVAELNGILWGGHEPLYLSARVAGSQGTHSRASTEPIWDPPAKIHARFLGPRLEALDEARAIVR